MRRRQLLGLIGWLETTVPWGLATDDIVRRLHAGFRRRIKTQTVLPSAETVAMLFWSLLVSRQTTMRNVDGWQSLLGRAA